MNKLKIVIKSIVLIISLILIAQLYIHGADSILSKIALSDLLPSFMFSKIEAIYKEVVLTIDEGYATEVEGEDIDDTLNEYVLYDDEITEEYALRNFYTIAQRTRLYPEDINFEKLNNINLKIDKNVDGPQVLIMHTHSSEMFVDSNPELGLSEGIWGVGEELKRILEEDYGLEVYHDTGRYDFVDGKKTIIGAYERMEPEIKKILDKYPSIQLVIDLHRDGVKDESIRLVCDINGEPCAKLMLFNGITRLFTPEGVQGIENLKNPYITENLALSYNLYVNANNNYPFLMRKIYVEAYRYSLHFKPLSILVEVGAQTSTKEEAKNSMKYLAKTISMVMLE